MSSAKRRYTENLLTPVGANIDDVIESHKAAVLAADAESLMRLYEPGVRVFDAWASGSTTVHEHTSAPIGFADAKAVLQREQA